VIEERGQHDGYPCRMIGFDKQCWMLRLKIPTEIQLQAKET